MLSTCVKFAMTSASVISIPSEGHASSHGRRTVAIRPRRAWILCACLIVSSPHVSAISGRNTFADSFTGTVYRHAIEPGLQRSQAVLGTDGIRQLHVQIPAICKLLELLNIRSTLDFCCQGCSALVAQGVVDEGGVLEDGELCVDHVTFLEQAEEYGYH
jgi:hypothetical protein